MIKNWRGNLLIALLALLPVLIWLVFENRPIDLDVVGRWTGLIAISLLSINIILSARFHVFDRLFYGLDRMYKTHHFVGGFTLIFALIHSNALIISASRVSLDAGFNLLTSTSDLALVAGRLSLMIMSSAMIVVLYFKVKYQWFITLQRILGGVIFIAGYHALFVAGSDVRSIPPLFFYMTLLGGSAAIIYIYRSLFHKPLNRKHTYKVISAKNKGSITEILLKPTKRRLQHYAGQFMFISFDSSRVSSEVHPFSISSGSSENYLRISAKNIGDYTKTLPNLKSGDIAHIEGPFGHFSYSKIGGKSQTWIAGGIGVTPFLSMAQSLKDRTPITLYYSVNNPNEAIYLEELETIAKNNRNFKLVPVYTSKDGKLSAETISKKSGMTDNILLCGPPGMMKALESQFISLGINKNNIHYEEFALS